MIIRIEDMSVLEIEFLVLEVLHPVWSQGTRFLVYSFYKILLTEQILSLFQLSLEVKIIGPEWSSAASFGEFTL